MTGFSYSYLKLASYFPASQDYTSLHLKCTCRFHLKSSLLLKFGTLTLFSLCWSPAWGVCSWLWSRSVKALRSIVLKRDLRALLDAVFTLTGMAWCFWFYPPSVWFQIWFVSFDPRWWLVFFTPILKVL